MTKQTLRGILWRRYRWLLIVAVLVLAFTGVRVALNIKQEPSLYLSPGAFSIADESVSMLFVTFVVTVVVGLTLFLSDNATGFSEYLLSLPISRRQIYRQKLALALAAVIGGYVLMQGLFIAVLQTQFHSHRNWFDWSATGYFALYQIAWWTVVLLVALTFSIWVGHLVASIFGALIFFGSTLYAYDALINVVSGIAQVHYQQVDFFTNLNPTTAGGVIGHLLICAVIIVGLYLANQWAYEHLSLENLGEFLLIPRLRPVVLWSTMGYLALAVSGSQFGWSILTILTGHDYSDAPVLGALVMAVVVAYLTWGLGRWLLYRPDHFYRVWGLHKLA